MTELMLINVPFESNYKDTVYFADEDDQLHYMSEHSDGLVRTDYSFQRKDGIIRYPDHIDNLYKYNYVGYKNENNKTMYAFITDMTYVNENRTDIHIQTDVIQTWMFDYTVKPSFVEREHTNDEAQINTVPETLEIGPYVCKDDPGKVDALTPLSIVWGVTESENGSNASGTLYNGMFSGIQYHFTVDYDVQGVINAITAYDANGRGEAIQCMFIAPRALMQKPDGEGTHLWGKLPFSDKPIEINVKWDDLFEGIYEDHFDGYEPRNKKLNTFPYCYLAVSNNNGCDVIYKYEQFYGIPSFTIKGVVTPGCSIRLTPDYYNGVHHNELEGINLGKFPICNWTSDVYTNWITQNSINVGVDAVSGVAQTLLGGATMFMSGGIVGAGGVASGLTSIGHTVGSVYQHSLVPPQSKGNINCGDVITASGNNNFFFYRMCIKPEYASIVDDFFDMFGYKTCRVKVPYTNHRPYYWYTKTLDVNIDGAIPNNDLEQIKRCYDNGITFWRANAEMGVYHSDEQDNSIN